MRRLEVIWMLVQVIEVLILMKAELERLGTVVLLPKNGYLAICVFMSAEPLEQSDFELTSKFVPQSLSLNFQFLTRDNLLLQHCLLLNCPIVLALEIQK